MGQDYGAVQRGKHLADLIHHVRLISVMLERGEQDHGLRLLGRGEAASLGIPPKAAQTLARHSTIRLTMDRLRTRRSVRPDNRSGIATKPETGESPRR